MPVDAMGNSVHVTILSFSSRFLSRARFDPRECGEVLSGKLLNDAAAHSPMDTLAHDYTNTSARRSPKNSFDYNQYLNGNES